MKKLIIKIIQFGIPILILIISVNYFGDAANLFSGSNSYEYKIADILASGKFATNISNYDERILQREIVDRMNKKPDVLVLGSSRSLLIKQDLFPKRLSIHNSSVSGASIEDLIAIYQMYKDRNIIPSKVIIGFDPWIFNKNNGQNRWKSIEKQYNSFFSRDLKNIKSYNYVNFEKYKQLLSISYFQNSLKLIPSVLQGKSLPVSTNIAENETATKLLDGTVKYGHNFRLSTTKIVNARVSQYMSSTPIYSLGKYTELSEKLIKLFISLVEDMKNQGIEIIFFLAPYHPIVYEEIKNNYKMVLESNEFIKRYAKQELILLAGSFNPHEVLLDETYFYDGMHCTEEGTKKILTRYNIN
jgi:hypothetical protein